MVDESLTERELWRNFYWMATWFSVSATTCTTPTIVASTLLDPEVAYVGNGILYTATCACTLFVAAPLVGRLGPKGGLLVGMFLYCMYTVSFTLAASLGGAPRTVELVWNFGSFVAGAAAGIVWTAQGDYFACTARLVAGKRGEQLETVTGVLGSVFAVIFLCLEVTAKGAFSCMQWLSVDVRAIGAVFLVMGGLALLMMSRTYAFTSPRGPAARAPAILEAVSLWSDPVIWLLAPTNLTFGFCAAFMNGYVNRNYASRELGVQVVGLLAAVTAAFAAAFSRVFGQLTPHLGKGAMISLGAVCFQCIPLCFFVLGCCGGWGWWLLALYALQGAGRAVYESTNKAAFADFFATPQRTAAFANCMLQSSSAFAVSFFLQTELTSWALACIVAALSALTPACFVLASAIKARRSNCEAALLKNAFDVSIVDEAGTPPCCHGAGLRADSRCGLKSNADTDHTGGLKRQCATCSGGQRELQCTETTVSALLHLYRRIRLKRPITQ